MSYNKWVQLDVHIHNFLSHKWEIAWKLVELHVRIYTTGDVQTLQIALAYGLMQFQENFQISIEL